MKLKILYLALSAGFLWLAGCNGNPPPTPTPTSDNATNKIANPASVYCEEHQGKLEIRTADDGSEFGMCIFEDDSECEEWAFYHGECKPGDSLSKIANPASVHCEKNGGKLEIRTADDGSEFGMCVFANGSECDEWAYYRGECTPKKQP